MANKKSVNTEKEVEVKNTKKATKKATKKSDSKKTSEVSKRKTVPKKQIVEEIVNEEVVESTPELEKTELIQVPDQVVKDAIKQVNKAAKKQARQELWGKIVEELIAFIFIIVIICLVVFGIGYWYKNYYDENKIYNMTNGENDKEKTSEYKIVSYNASSSNLNVINDKYLVEYDKDYKKVVKVLDRDLNVLYEGSIEISKIIPDVNGNLYAYLDEDAESENLITLYKLTDGEFEKVNDMADNGYYYTPLIYRTSDDYNYLLGFYGEENSDQKKSVIYNLNDKKIELEGYTLVGDYVKSSTDSSIITRNKNYVSIKSISSKRIGLYDLNAEQMLFEALYDEIYCTYDDNFVIKKDGKVGILNNKSKKIVDFLYDFIDINYGYYVVSKDSKLAIMDNEYKLVTGFDFDYQLNNYYRGYTYTKNNSFASYKINNFYLLIINNNEKLGTYNKHKAYVISNDGTVKDYDENYMIYNKDDNFLYSYSDDTEVYTVYNYDENGIIDTYEVRLNGYDLSNVTVSKYNDDIVRINNDIFINYKENKELDDVENIKEYKFDSVSIKYDYDKNKVYVIDNDNELSNYSIKNKNNINIRKDGTVYAIFDKDYISIEKVS